MTTRYDKPCPFRYKDELVDWATKHFNKPKSLYTKLSIRALKAIWYKEDEKRINKQL